MEPRDCIMTASPRAVARDRATSTGRILATRLRATSICVDRLANPRDCVGPATDAAWPWLVTGSASPTHTFTQLRDRRLRPSARAACPPPPLFQKDSFQSCQRDLQ